MLPGTPHPKQLCLPSHIAVRSYNNGGITWLQNFLQSNSMHTTSSSPWTRLSEPWSEADKQSYSLIVISSPTSTLPTYSQMESKELWPHDLLLESDQRITPLRHAGNLTALKVAKVQPGPADTDMLASNASSQDMVKTAALS